MFALGFPLLLIPFAVYNMIVFLTPGVSWTSPVTTVHMMSGQDWVLTWEDILLAFAIFLLCVAMLIEFLLVQKAATSTFFLLMAIALVDALAGFVVGMRTAGRQIEVEG